MKKFLSAMNLISAIAAFCAAVFWFLSAAGNLPPITSYWDHTPASDPFFAALQTGVQMNRIAAVFAGVSALATAVSVAVGHLDRLHARSF